MSNPSQARIVVTLYRSDEQISELLDQLAVTELSADRVTRERTLTVLDDLAEEMIGRQRNTDTPIRKEIQIRCDRLRESMR